MRRRLATVAAITAVAATAFLGGCSASATPDFAQLQYGTVYSYTTHGHASVSSTNGGYVWCYNGNCNAKPPRGVPQYQQGTVHSDTTGRNALVSTGNYGIQWDYEP